MTTTTRTATRQHAQIDRIVLGAVAGLVGGVIFGMLMQMMGMIEMIAMLVGSSSVAVAWIVHLLISAAIGAGFGLVLGSRATTFPLGVATGLAYGAAWWILGPLVLMPAKLGMPLFAIDATAGKSLMGHLIFGAVTGAVYVAAKRRSH
jgi:hypothetical protein